MPELPEVETIVRQLNKKVLSKTIKNAWLDSFKILKKGLKSTKFFKIITGQKIIKVTRRGKNIFLELTNNFICLIHLKLTGSIFLIQKKDLNKMRFIRFYLEFSKKDVLVLVDRRKFAKIILDKKENVLNLKEIQQLGPEPLSNKFTIELLSFLIKNRKKNIKQFLMDQKIIAGIGNIYASEILWEAKVNPFSYCHELNSFDIKNIFQAIKKILRKAVKNRGSTLADKAYRDTNQKEGNYGETRKVYHRHKEKCFRCQSQIKKAIIASRSTFYCPVCQK